MISIKTLRSRGRLSIASMAMLLLLGPVLTMSAVAQDPSGDDVAQRPSPQVEDGFVFLDGEWLEPPFEISVEATQLYLNGMPVKPWPGLRDLGDEARLRAESPETANELAVIAAIHLEQLGGSALDPVPAEVVDRITSLIESFPATAGVRVEGGRFFVVDRQGVEAAMSLAPIPGESPAERAAALHEEAAGWTQTLEAGGVLFLLPGMSLEISAGETPTVLGDVVAALNGPGDATVHLEAILDARPIAEAVASAGGPGATFLERLAERQAQARQTAPDSSGVLKSLLPPEADDGDIAYGGKHRWSETPSSNRAYIFTPAAGSPLQRVRFIDSPTCQPEPIKKAAGSTVIGSSTMAIRSRPWTNSWALPAAPGSSTSAPTVAVRIKSRGSPLNSTSGKATRTTRWSSTRPLGSRASSPRPAATPTVEPLVSSAAAAAHAEPDGDADHRGR